MARGGAPAAVAAGAPAAGRAPVAEAVAGRLLRLAGADGPRAESVTRQVDWAGPVGLPLAEEREVQAACGLMHVHGRADGRPTPLAVDYASTVAGVLAAQGVCAALIGRARGLDVTGVRTSVAGAALFALAQYLAAATAERDGDGDGGGGSGVGAGAEEASGGARQEAAGAPGFVSADGVPFEVEALDAGPWLEFWRRLGAPQDGIRRGWPPFQSRFAAANCPLPAGLGQAARSVAFTEIRAAARSSGADVLPVRRDPRPPTAVPPWTLTPLSGRPGAPIGPYDGGTGGGGAAALPLSGLRVVESARRVQGPLAGHALRLLGADVLRVEPPGGDPLRGVPPMVDGCSARFAALNAQKGVVEADITTAGGRDTVRELVSGADVFVHNWAPGKAGLLGLDADDLHAVRPGLVYAAASGWGDALGTRPPVGTDFLAQAHSGLAAALRPRSQPPAPSLATLTDVLGGLVSAQAVLAALLARLRSGHGRRADSSLYSAALVVPRPAHRVEWNAWEWPLPARDGWLWLGPRARARPERVAAAAGLGRSADAAAVAARVRGRPAAEWLDRFAEADVPATPVCADLAGLARDPRFAGALDGGSFADRPAAPRTPWEFA